MFGSEGGYDKILSLLINENSPKLELLHEFLSWLEICYGMYHRDFIQKFAPAIKNSIEDMTLKMSGINHEDANKEQIDNILYCL